MTGPLRLNLKATVTASSTTSTARLRSIGVMAPAASSASHRWIAISHAMRRTQNPAVMSGDQFQADWPASVDSRSETRLSSRSDGPSASVISGRLGPDVSAALT